MADQHHLQFPFLSDEGNRVARQFGLIYRVPEYQQEIYQRAFVNLPFVNGDSSWELAIPATFIVGPRKAAGEPQAPPEPLAAREPEHSVVYASSNPDYTDRPEPADIQRRIQQLSS